MDLINIIEYFAKFPDRNGVLKNFSKESSIFSEYATLKNLITALPEPVMPEIKDFVFTDDEKKLREIVKSITSYFLLIEWGPIAINAPAQMHNRNGEWNFAINIAHPTDSRGFDRIENALLSAKCLDLVIKLADFVATDDKEACSTCRLLDCDITISPIDPFLFMQCQGWSLTFKKKFNNKF